MPCYLPANAKRQNLHSQPFPSIIEGLDILSQSLFIGSRELNSLGGGGRLGGARGAGAGMFVSFAIRP